MFPLYFHLDANVGKKKFTSNICSRPRGPPLKCGIIYLHSMVSQRMNEGFINYGHKPTSVLFVSSLWHDGGEDVGTTEMYEKTFELEGYFQKAASSAIHDLIPYSVRFDGCHDRISAHNAIDLVIFDIYDEVLCLTSSLTISDLPLLCLGLRHDYLKAKL